jgi:hypothetical protein
MACPNVFGVQVVSGGVPLYSIRRFAILSQPMTYPLVPVGIDHDGKAKPIDRLTYKQAKRLAKKAAFKTYRIKRRST